MVAEIIREIPAIRMALPQVDVTIRPGVPSDVPFLDSLQKLHTKQVGWRPTAQLVPVLMCVWSYSHAPFAIALPNEKVESILHGMVCALEFFGCVPLEVWWDYPATVVSLMLKGRDRKPNPNYAALASHYRFAPMFCMPARGQSRRLRLRARRVASSGACSRWSVDSRRRCRRQRTSMI